MAVTVTVLAIDSTRRGEATLALAERDGTIVATASVQGPLDTGIPPLLAGMMPAAVEAVVVITGPGSYTGVRGGMALALGLATGRGVPLHGVDILTAVAAAGPPAPEVTAAVDAGRGGVYVRAFRQAADEPRPVGGARRVPWAALRNVPGPVVSPAPAEGVVASIVSIEHVLAAAVPIALAAAPLGAAGLAAVPPPAQD